VDTPGSAGGVYVSGSYAYVADGGETFGLLEVINITDPTDPTLVGSVDMPDWAYGVYVSGSFACVAASYSGLYLIRASD